MSKHRSDQSSQSSAERKSAAESAPPKAKAKSKARTPSPWPWGRFARLAVSALVVFHMAAVFSAPWFIQIRSINVPALPPGAAVRDAQGRVVPLDRLDPREYPRQAPHLPLAMYDFFFHYTNLLYINNGYDFFSPDPAPSQLVRYWVYDSAGNEIANDTFPDLKSQWPRLFYHRHMMLAAQVNEFGEDGLRMYARRLLRSHAGASRVYVELGVHELLMPDRVRDGTQLDATETYRSVGSVEVVADRPEPSGGAVQIPGAAR